MRVGFPDVKRIGTRLFNATAWDLDRDTARGMVRARVDGGMLARYYPYRSRTDNSVKYAVYTSRPGTVIATFAESEVVMRT
jgi:hypothetical protein